MDTGTPYHVKYGDLLAAYQPEIEAAPTIEALSTISACLLSEAENLFNVRLQPSFNQEVAYLWAIFSANTKSTNKYRQMIQVLLAQVVDCYWHARSPQYETDRDVKADDSLLDFSQNGRGFQAHFEYVQYYDHVLMRIPNSLRLRYRRFTNHPGRYTQGLRTTRCKKGMIALINQIAEDAGSEINLGRPFKVMVNSILRTVEYQNRLAALGYIAPRFSAHLAGYAADVEMLWYEKHDPEAFAALENTLDALYQEGTVNVIEEGTHWHVCLNPAAIPTYEALFARWERGEE